MQKEAQKKVLVVEDSLFVSNAIKIVLQSGAIEVTQVLDSTKAIDTAKNSDFDLIMLDLMMPGLTGTEIFQLLRKEEKTKKIPVMILTAKADALKWEPDLKGCDKFMTKPFDNKELLSEVKKLIGL